MSASLRPATVPTRWLGRHFDTHDAVDSTNAAAWRLADEGAPHGALVVAARQTAGRGRQGRRWTSAPGNLFASFVLRRDRFDGGDAALSLVVGLEIASTLRHDFGVDAVGVKWPNDVLVDGSKIAGVLAEARTDDGSRIVIGFGVNLRTPADGWGDLAGRATALDAHGIESEPADFLQRFLPRLERGLESFDADGFAAFRRAWEDFDVLSERAVEFESDGRRSRARVRGVDARGALEVVDDRGDVRALFGGEVHLTDVES